MAQRASLAKAADEDKEGKNRKPVVPAKDHFTSKLTPHHAHAVLHQSMVEF